MEFWKTRSSSTSFSTGLHVIPNRIRYTALLVGVVKNCTLGLQNQGRYLQAEKLLRVGLEGVAGPGNKYQSLEGSFLFGHKVAD